MVKGFKDKDKKFHPTEQTTKLSSKDILSKTEPRIKIDNQIIKEKKEFEKHLKNTEDEVESDYGLFIANGYDELKHDPKRPEVKRAYDRFIEETVEQAIQLQKSGMIFDVSGSLHYCTSHGIPCGKGGNYETANEMHDDIQKNKHIFYRKSDNDYKGFQDHPLFRMTNIKNYDGEKMRANDVFRVVHDINGHNKAMRSEFTPKGEQEAYLEHKKLYSPEATRALFTETQGQGSWVNFNKKTGERNRHFQDIGEIERLKFPPQKADIFPDRIIFCR